MCVLCSIHTLLSYYRGESALYSTQCCVQPDLQAEHQDLGTHSQAALTHHWVRDDVRFALQDLSGFVRTRVRDGQMWNQWECKMFVALVKFIQNCSYCFCWQISLDVVAILSDWPGVCLTGSCEAWGLCDIQLWGPMDPNGSQWIIIDPNRIPMYPNGS